MSSIEQLRSLLGEIQELEIRLRQIEAPLSELPIKFLMQKAPSLRPKLSESVFTAYPPARELASRETEIQVSEFPKDCPYGDNDLLDPEFFPVPR